MIEVLLHALSISDLIMSYSFKDHMCVSWLANFYLQYKPLFEALVLYTLFPLIYPLGCLIGLSKLTCPNKMFKIPLKPVPPIVFHISVIETIFPRVSQALFIPFFVSPNSIWSISKFYWFYLQIMPWLHLLFSKSILCLLYNPLHILIWLLKLASNWSACSFPVCSLLSRCQLLKMSCNVLCWNPLVASLYSSDSTQTS